MKPRYDQSSWKALCNRVAQETDERGGDSQRRTLNGGEGALCSRSMRRAERECASYELLPDAPQSVDQQGAISNSIPPCQGCLCCDCCQLEVWAYARVFFAAGNTVSPKRANLNPEKVEECVIIRCNLRLLKYMGLRSWKETSVHVHLFTYSCSIKDEKMILCARVYWICHSICWVFHLRLCFIAFKMKSYYPVPSHFQFSVRDGSGT